jgi:hypothetical protein
MHMSELTRKRFQPENEEPLPPAMPQQTLLQEQYHLPEQLLPARQQVVA